MNTQSLAYIERTPDWQTSFDQPPNDDNESNRPLCSPWVSLGYPNAGQISSGFPKSVDNLAAEIDTFQIRTRAA